MSDDRNRFGRQRAGRYAFIIPRYGKSVGGGAETLTSQLAQHLASRGDIVEIWTTCAADNRTWQNVYPQAQFIEDGVRVSRFLVDARNLDVWVPLQVRLSEGLTLSIDEQLEWMQQSVNSSALYEHIHDYGPEFDALFFAPYLFGTTFHGSLIHPHKSCLIPCLHDEQYAYVDIIASMFRQVRGALFNAIPEQELASRLYGEVAGGEVGMGFIAPGVEEVQALRPYFAEDFPYLLYVGRKETGKNVHMLVDYFVQSKNDEHIPENVRLVIVGGGSFEDVQRPAASRRSDIIDLPHVSEEEKRRLIKHALVLCQPSVNESFSIVLMEAWLLGVPVLVHAGCAVTRYHAVESGGGLYFASLDDFAGAVSELGKRPEMCAALGCAGREYVLSRYNWQAVVGRFDQVMKRL